MGPRSPQDRPKTASKTTNKGIGFQANFIIDFLNESDSISTIFSYYAPNNPDSLIIPLGNLVQQFITGEINYNNGLMIGLNPNQYLPSYNFNNIIIDKLKLPYMELYYFK